MQNIKILMCFPRWNVLRVVGKWPVAFPKSKRSVPWGWALDRSAFLTVFHFLDNANRFVMLKRSLEGIGALERRFKFYIKEFPFCHLILGMDLWNEVGSWIYRDWLITTPVCRVVLFSFFVDAVITDSMWNRIFFLLKSLFATCAITCTLTFIPKCT